MKLEWKTCFKVGLSAFLLYLAIFYWNTVSLFLGNLISAISPLIAGFAIAYVLNILMRFYEDHYFPNHSGRFVKSSRPILCMVASIITLLAIIAIIIRLIVPELISCISFLLSKIPPVVDRIITELSKNEYIMEVLPKDIIASINALDIHDIIAKGTKILISGLGSAAESVFSAVKSIVSVTITLFISIIFSVYFLLGRDRFVNQLTRVIHSYCGKFESKIVYFAKVFNDSFKKYIVGQCVEAMILWLLCTVGMMIFKFEYAQMISAFIGFTALIPVAGAYIGAAVGAVMILTVSPIKALLFILFIIVLQQIEGNLIYPRVVGKSVGLPAIWVLAAITIGGSLKGIVGMFVAVPIFGAAYRIIKDNLAKRESLEREEQQKKEIKKAKENTKEKPAEN